MNNESFNQKELLKKIQSVLLKNWDPIGINNIPEANDEYDNYVYPIFNLLSSNKSEREIFEYLWWIETEYMGLVGNKIHTKGIAQILFQLSSLS